jgi:predicted nucleic acid-binding protein
VSSLIAVLDANVLIPAAPRDTLLRAAEARLFQLRWSDDILGEVERNLVGHGLTSDLDARDLLNEMRSYFPEALVRGYEPLVTSMSNAPEDRHVLAAAVRAGAHVIVTENRSDFPQDALAPFGIEAQTIDRFLTELFLGWPARMVRIVQQQADDLNDPPMTIDELLDELSIWAPTFVDLVRERSG